MSNIESLEIEGYKTIKFVRVSLNPSVNVLIGANGAGKSNFISLLRMLHQMALGKLQAHVTQSGGAAFFCAQDQQKIALTLELAGGTRYACEMIPSWGALMLAAERLFQDALPVRSSEDAPAPESRLLRWAEDDQVAHRVLEAMRGWRAYHFRDMGSSARVRQMVDIGENKVLLEDGSNLAAYLYLLREEHPGHYRTIVETIRMAMPFFGDFVLRPHPLNPEKIRLEWHERSAQVVFGPDMLSDGALRYICLTTLLLQPAERLPSLIILDEPELGLHPFSLRLVASMVCSAASNTQVILATQSVTLLNQFTPENVLVAQRVKGETTICHLDGAVLAGWLEDYGLGDLFDKNVINAAPSY